MRSFTFLIFFLFCFEVISQCPDELIINSQQDIDVFIDQYPECKTLERIMISDQVDDYSKLDILDTVGSLEVKSSQLKHLDIESFFFIRDVLSVNSNPMLKSLNAVFTDSSGFERSLLIGNNDSLEKVVAKVDYLRYINVQHNRTMDFSLPIPNIYVENVSIIGEVNVIANNLKVTKNLLLLENNNYSDFKALNKVLNSKYSNLINIGLLDSFSISGLASETKKQEITFTDIQNLDLTAEISGEVFVSVFRINRCSNLTEIRNIPHLRTESFAINNCENLESITGSNFVEKNFLFLAANNPKLEDIRGLNGILDWGTFYHPSYNFDYDLILRNNPNLNWCSYPSVCMKIAEDENRVDIQDNATACLDKLAVIDGCLSGTPEHKNNELTIYPNPASQVLNFKSEDLESIQIYSLIGELILSLSLRSESRVELGELIPGSYVVLLTTKDGRQKREILIKL